MQVFELVPSLSAEHLISTDKCNNTWLISVWEKKKQAALGYIPTEVLA